MTFVAPDSAPSNAARIPSIVILGADALLAALPATPVQLAHACALAGYQSVVPASWGDELIAAATLRALRQHGPLPAIHCSCPHVAHRLLAVGTDLRPFLISLVAPPVVLARYLRAVHASGKLRITYVGRCPGAADESIDARLTPEELLAIFADRQIVLDEQPLVFDSVLPPDRRRYRSQPGGLPTPEVLWAAPESGGAGARSLVELYGDGLPVELAQHLLAGKPVLIDAAPKLGCVCSGATPGVDPADARARVTALEPPRVVSPILDESVNIDAALALPASPRSGIDVVSPPTANISGMYSDDTALPDERPRMSRYEELSPHQSPPPPADAGEVTAGAASRRLSPARGVTRHAGGTLPTARDAGGRQLPRTYVARRRSPSRRARSGATAQKSSIQAEGLAPALHDRAATLPNGSTEHQVEPSSGAAPPLDAGASSFEVRASVTSIAATDVLAAIGVESVEPAAIPRQPIVTPEAEHPQAEPPRHLERAVALPVTARSDGPPRSDAASQATPERPVMQLLTLGLLISMIVLVSAAVGVLVGRWMTQR